MANSYLDIPFSLSSLCWTLWLWPSCSLDSAFNFNCQGGLCQSILAIMSSWLMATTTLLLYPECAFIYNYITEALESGKWLCRTQQTVSVIFESSCPSHHVIHRNWSCSKIPCSRCTLRHPPWHTQYYFNPTGRRAPNTKGAASLQRLGHTAALRVLTGARKLHPWMYYAAKRPEPRPYY